MNSNILIIGAGISGLMTALECRQAGVSVTLLDKSASGQEASWAGGGILSPLYPWREVAAIHQLRRWSEQQYPLLASMLRDATGINVELIRCGILIADNDDPQLVDRELTKQNITFTWIDDHDLANSYPGLNLTASYRCLLPQIAQIRNPFLLKALKQYLIQQNVKILEHQKVTQLNIVDSGHHIDSVETANCQLFADKVVLTAGAWSQTLWPETNMVSALEIFPVKGQMLLLQAQPGIIPSIILQNHKYIVPRHDGHILVGSTVEHDGFNKVNTVTAKRQLKDFFDNLYPALSDLPVIKHWAGLRPGTNRPPVICKHPEIDNLYINSGHFRNGLNLAPASARLIADLILDREPIIPPLFYNL